MFSKWFPTAVRRPPAAGRRTGWFSAIRERIFANFFLFDRSYRDLGAERIFKAVTFKLTDIKGKQNFILLYLMENSCIGFKACTSVYTVANDDFLVLKVKVECQKCVRYGTQKFARTELSMFRYAFLVLLCV